MQVIVTKSQILHSIKYLSLPQVVEQFAVQMLTNLSIEPMKGAGLPALPGLRAVTETQTP